MTSLFDPLHVGDFDVANRVVMAPLTRNRAEPGRVPGDLHVAYYRQRASAGIVAHDGEQGIAHLRAAEMHRIDDLGRRRVLGKERRQPDRGRAVDDESQAAFRLMVQQQDHALVEERVEHLRHGEQQQRSFEGVGLSHPGSSSLIHRPVRSARAAQERHGRSAAAGV